MQQRFFDLPLRLPLEYSLLVVVGSFSCGVTWHGMVKGCTGSGGVALQDR